MQLASILEILLGIGVCKGPCSLYICWQAYAGNQDPLLKEELKSMLCTTAAVHIHGMVCNELLTYGLPEKAGAGSIHPSFARTEGRTISGYKV
jgi:hypothetical protein